MDYKFLIEEAKKVRERAYVPNTKFKVGAAVLTKSGKIYTGCNVESVGFGSLICGERNALFKAISEGEKDFEAIAIVGAEDFTFPCGICRQVLLELAGDCKIIASNIKGESKVVTIQELMPYSYKLEDYK